tara:strand:- start:908 stop:2068 length:1161 start_codon:yes stop_codon:yes gene_type:complete
VNTVVTISGGGIIGNYISSRLNANNISTLVIEKNSDVLDFAENVRTVTLNQHSKNLIEKLGVNIPHSEINEILVFDGEGSGKINFHSKDIDEENLSYVVFFNDLYRALQEKEKQRTIFGNTIEDIKENIEGQICEVLLTNKDKINSSFVAGCDGRNSNIAKLANLNINVSDYDQTAVTFTTRSDLQNNKKAFQVFSERGIFAAMPVPKNNSDSTHTIVWSIENNKLNNVKTVESYVKENISYFEGKLNIEFEICSNLLTFKLTKHHFDSYISDSMVLIGDAAHSIHPLAGQGINLGFADADVFCDELIKGFEKSRKINRELILKRYEVRRKQMNLLMLKSMDFFVEVFSSENLFVKLARNIGLSGVNKMKFLKTFFINHASGKNKL